MYNMKSRFLTAAGDLQHVHPNLCSVRRSYLVRSVPHIPNRTSLASTHSSVLLPHLAAKAVNSKLSVLLPTRRRFLIFGLFTNVVRITHPPFNKLQYLSIVIGFPIHITICPPVAQLPIPSQNTCARRCLTNTKEERGRWARCDTDMHLSLVPVAAWETGDGSDERLSRGGGGDGGAEGEDDGAADIDADSLAVGEAELEGEPWSATVFVVGVVAGVGSTRERSEGDGEIGTGDGLGVGDVQVSPSSNSLMFVCKARNVQLAQIWFFPIKAHLSPDGHSVLFGPAHSFNLLERQ